MTKQEHVAGNQLDFFPQEEKPPRRAETPRPRPKRPPNMEVVAVVNIGNCTNKYVEIGSAWRNANGSIWIKLHATPTSGAMLVRPKTANEEDS